MSIHLTPYADNAAAQTDAIYIFIHGWSMNHKVFAPLVEQLAIPALGMDLPGHGQNQGDVTANLKAWQNAALAAIHAQAQQNAKIHLVGWSLGGMLATVLANALEDHIASLTLIASNPKFTQSEDWQTAVPQKNLYAFIDNLQTNQQQVVSEFMHLQMRGAPQAATSVEQVLALVAAGGAASLAGLHAGLTILDKADVREDYAQLTCPIHCLLGKRDALVPFALAKNLETLNAQTQTTLLERASHAPFISHAQETVQAMQSFWQRL